MTEVTSFDKLFALVEQIKRLSSTERYSGIGEARALPHKWSYAAKSVQVSARSSYGRQPDAVELQAAADIQTEFEVRYRAKGEEERRKRLIEISYELESLRVELPHIAAKACIEIGVVARECRTEAERNHPIGDAA